MLHRHRGTVLPLVLCLLASSLPASPQRHARAHESDRSAWYEATYGTEHLPRFELGRRLGEVEFAPPIAIDVAARRSAAESTIQGGPRLSGRIASPPEYSPTDGVLFRYGAGWTSVVVDCVVGLTADPTKDEIAYVVVTSTSQRNAAQTTFANAGADLSKVRFLIEPSNSIWLRDYGPHFIWQGGTRTIVDSHYYSSRPLDNYVPTLVARDEFDTPAWPMGLYYSGGNFQPGPSRAGFTTSLVFQDNPGMTQAEIADLYQRYQGIDTLHVFQRLPGSVDGTGHIDMWMYLVDEDDVIISQFEPGSNATAIEITENAVTYMENLGFTVWRTPAWNVGFTHYTYTNAFRVNDRIFSIKYRDGNAAYADEDAAALAAFQAAAGPGVEIIPIDCYSIIPASGAIHCIVMQVPRYTAAEPSAHMCAPDGGELLVEGETVEIQWAADDDQAIASVDLLYSLDGGVNFLYPIATGLADTGEYTWTVPRERTDRAVLKVRATDAQGNQGLGFTETTLSLRPHPQRVYDFASEAGVDRFVWGSSTTSWDGVVAGNRYPVTSELTPAQYAALAFSDATGGDGDTNRYRAPSPSGGRETAHVYEFTLDERRGDLLDVAMSWEGYGDQCIQMELYVWDLVAQDWGNGEGGTGENAYMAIFAGNEDATLVGHLQRDLARYVDSNGRVTFLLYGERSNQESFHDYASLTVTYREKPRHSNPPAAGVATR